MNILITNQHHNNHGDESAVIGMISALRKVFGETTNFHILLQSGRHRFLDKEYNVEESPMMIGPFLTVQLILWMVLFRLGIDLSGLLSPVFRNYIKLYKSADLVLSSCGGPYIGDIYANHEFLHHWHLDVSRMLDKPYAFYAPSMGPFRNKNLMRMRKRTLNNAMAIVLRDPISQASVLDFGIDPGKVFLAADACLSDRDIKKVPSDPNAIGMTLIDYSFRNHDHPEQAKTNYLAAMREVADTLLEENPARHITLFPQLYGKHSDVPFLTRFISSLKHPERVAIYPPDNSGPRQQEKIGSMHLMIACRYHSAIFSSKMNVPCLCVAYEHKAVGFMKMLGLEEFVIDIGSINSNAIMERINKIENNYKDIIYKLKYIIPLISDQADNAACFIEEKYLERYQ